ncbi:MAG: hypothetical protein ACRDHF_01100 [Tepidiformaceae bacterium]
MALSDIRPETLELLRAWRYDRTIEKHEGPESWRSYLEHEEPAELIVNGRRMLIPVWWDERGEIIVLRWLVSQDESSITVFFKDMTLGKHYPADQEMFWAGFLAVCDRIPGDDVYAAVVYHEWFIIDNAAAST